MTDAAPERRRDPEGRPRAGQVLQQALNRGVEQTGGNDNIETWDQICAALQMTLQLSPFQPQSSGSKCHAARTFATMPDPLSALCGDDRGARSASSPADERRAMVR